MWMAPSPSQDIYGLLSAQLKQEIPEDLKRKRHATWQGVNWANYGGEGAALDCNNILSVDGIHNVIHVLEEIENGRLDDLDFFEGASCVGGCVGGPLVFENAFVAKNSLRKLIERMRADEREHPLPPAEPRTTSICRSPWSPCRGSN